MVAIIGIITAIIPPTIAIVIIDPIASIDPITSVATDDGSLFGNVAASLSLKRLY